jgi:hypothetical protein
LDEKRERKKEKGEEKESKIKTSIRIGLLS